MPSEVKYMECKACGEVFEMVDGSRFPEAAVAHQAKGEDCRGAGFKRDLTEDEAF